MELPKCPHCGLNSFLIYVQVRGTVEYYYDETGAFQESAWDRVRVHGVQTKTVRCGECGKIRRDMAMNKAKLRIIKKDVSHE